MPNAGTLPGSETHHVWDLTQALGATPNPKVSTRPTALPDHIFSVLMEQFQQAIFDKRMNKLEDLLKQYLFLIHLFF